ncbi:hypothetical protein CPB86DRAFT_745086 [Serendipita vermifera]|nr:hypothetical protein CPB86DRAFT_745086 [Serendipita vermifera]
MSLEEPITILTAHGKRETTCGYCGPPGGRSEEATSVTVGATPSQLSCSVYQAMVDRNWRRAGQYTYKPLLSESCCPQYPIRLDALKFEPTRNQRKALYRFNRYIIDGDNADGASMEREPQSAAGAAHSGTKDKPAKGKNVKPRKQVFSLVDSIHEPEATYRHSDFPAARHKFEIVLEPSDYTQEKYELYYDYQTHVHHETDTSPQDFERFLCNTDLVRTKIPYSTSPVPKGLPTHYGTHHQLYRIDGELVAMSVLDILPGCVSGVYFMYGAKWERLQLGKLSVLREAVLAREMFEAGLPTLKWVYLGFYVHSCQKMRYKGDYSPSFLLDPESNEWYPLEQCKPLLDKHRYACFSNPDHSSNAYVVSSDRPLQKNDLTELKMLRYEGQQLAYGPLSSLEEWRWQRHGTLRSTIGALGLELSKRIFFFIPRSW